MEQRLQESVDVGSFTPRQLCACQADLFGAGSETIINTIMFALMFLAGHEDCQHQIQTEMEQECGESEPTTHHSLPYLRAVILEVARMRPVNPMGVPHGVLAPVSVHVHGGQWTLSPGTMVIPLQWAANYDPGHWSEPELFKPERFLDNEGHLLSATNIYPFQVAYSLATKYLHLFMLFPRWARDVVLEKI